MDSEFLIRMTFYVCSALAVIFLAEALYLGVIAPMRSRRAINKRLSVQSEVSGGEQAMLRLKAQRGIDDRDLSVMGGLRKMLVQSGLTINLGRFLMIVALACSVLVTGLLVLTTLPMWVSIAVGLAVGIGLPLFVVRYIRNKRRAAFQAQLPDALDVVVRSPIRFHLSCVTTSTG